MKPIISLTIVLFLCTCSPPEEKNGLEMQATKGRVKHFTETKYDAVNGKMQVDSFSHSDFSEFNKNGEIVFWVRTDPNGKELVQTSYDYNEDGQWTRQNIKSAKTGETHLLPEFKGKKLIGAKEFAANDSLMAIYKYTFDGNGFYKEIQRLAPDSELISIQTFETQQGQRTRESYNYKDNGNITYLYKYDSLDAHGNWQVKKTFLENDDLVHVVQRELKYFE